MLRSRYVLILAAVVAILGVSAPAALALSGHPTAGAARELTQSPSTGSPATTPPTTAPPATAPSASGPSASGPRAELPANVGAIHSKLHVDLQGAALSAAAKRCAMWADKAGFANNGYLGGSLTTAVAIALAESGCRAGACYNNTTGRECTESGTRHSHDSIDRGPWQINSHAWPGIKNSCAYRGSCAAKRAYAKISAYGTFFAPWTTYLTDRFAHYLWAAQKAVNARHRGTITSALIGSCAAHPAHGGRGEVRLANCGSAAATQQWREVGASLRTGNGRCMTAPGKRRHAVLVRRCTGGENQRWKLRAGSTLYNAGDRLCLTDSNRSLRPGHVLTAGRCHWHQDDAWFKP